MWTNVFKIGGLHQISWFQFLPHESDLNPLPEKSVKVDQKDAAMLLVLSSHLQLQKEGFLSSWTNSFVGPWDPSQGVHNPDEKIKLWLFLPGRHSSVVETAQPAVSRLRVVASGFWRAPGDSEEVAAAFSQALRNCIERALIGLSYMRFGDVFSQCHQCQIEETSRRGQPTVEFIFAATEEAIFVHAVVSSKHIRTLSSGDLEKVLKHSTEATRKLPVIVSPHGIRGSLTGCSPSDLVKQGYFRSSNGIIGLPCHISQSFGCQLRGQNCYVEVSLGFPRSGSDKGSQPNSNGIKSLPKLHVSETPIARSDQKGSPNHLPDYEKTFLYPAEAVLVPVLQTSFARSSLRRFWLQNWMGPSLPGSSFFMHCSAYNVDSTEDPWSEANGNGTQHGYDSSSNSNSRSISSSSASSSDSDFKTTAPSELEADADSLTCRQSAVSSGDRVENDGSKLGSKRPRSGLTESLSHVGTATNVPVQDAYMSDFGSMEVNDSAITAVANDQIGSDWDWDDDDRGMEMDIQALLSEFGDFGDFFENDVLPFGEPPGTAESQALIFSAPDCGDVNSSPVGMMDIPDQMLLPVGFSSFDSFNPPSSAAMEECLSKTQDNMNNTMSLAPVSHTPMSSTGEFDHIIKAEAMMTFAPEFGAVETPTSELSTTLFKSPYFPNSRKSESLNSSSNNYLYSAAPPSSPCIEVSEGKNGMNINTKTFPSKQDTNLTAQSKSCYTYVESRKVTDDKRSHISNDNIVAKSEGLVQPPFCNIGSNASVKFGLRKPAEGSLEAEHFLLSAKTLLATDIACIMFQASMCKLRHILLSSSNLMHVGLGKSTGATILNQLPSDPSNTTDNISGKFEVKKKENIPVRIAGDIDGGMFDGHHNAPVGVWRAVVGVSKGVKPSSSPNMEVSSSFSHNSFNEEGILSYGQRQPLQELLDGIALLVQQATSFVDLALDADCCDGPYGWLALQEQWRRRFCCGPSMVHAGCGGTLASSHSLDIAGVELVDPLSADVHASTVISLLQSDIKTALKSAFSNLEGPLYVTDWCKGRNQLIDAGSMIDGISAESSISECRDSSEPMSPSQSSVGGSSGLKVSSMMDGAKVDETSQRRSAQDADTEQPCSRLRPTLIALPFPSILVGYQDDWLKTSACCLQHWEKAPLEPYALQKPITYQIVCPDIDPLTSAAADFFQQLGTVYETCKLGTHSPQGLGNQMEIDSAKLSSSGFVLLDSPQSMKIESSNASFVGSISDYFLSLSNGWDLTSYLKSLSKALRALKLGPCLSTNSNEGSNSSCMVIYVVCPFPDPTAILQTVIESSVAIGSVIQQSDRERRSILHSQFVKALSGLATVDETSTSNILVLSGFSIPKLVLQVVTVDAIFRVTYPSVSEVVILKETAFTVYNKARRISRGSSNDGPQSAFSNRSHSVLTQMSSPISGMWKDCVGPRITGHSLPREGDIDASLRSGTWDNSWQPARTGGLSCDPSRSGDYFVRDENRYMFEPLFILADPGSIEHGISFSGSLTSESSKVLADDISGNYIQNTSILGTLDSASSLDGLESDQKAPPSLHCCYGWTEDWRWLVCIWTDSRGELLDSNIFPFGGISSRQDTKGLQCLFVQVLQQGCQLLHSCSSPDTGVAKPRDFVIARVGGFYELEYLEWQKAIYSVGGSEMKRWPLQLRRSMSDGLSATSNGSSLQQTEMTLMQERTLPSSPSPLYSPHAKASGFVKGSLGQATARKQLMGGHPLVDNSRGLLHWAQSISFVAISMDHTLQLVLPTDSSSPGGTQSGSGMSILGYIEGFTPVKSLGSTSSAYLLIPSPSMRFLPPTTLQLPTCLTAESPPLAHLLHSKGSALPLSTGFVVSKAVPSMKKDNRSNLKEEWPSILSVNLVDYYGGTNIVRGVNKQGSRSLNWEAKDFEIETHLILESLAAELHALSWMTVSPAYLERRTALPFHCDMVLRVRRLLHFADKELSKQSEKS